MSMQVRLDAYEKNDCDRCVQEGTVTLEIQKFGIGNVEFLELNLDDCRHLGGKVMLRVTDLVSAVNCLTNKGQSSDN